MNLVRDAEGAISFGLVETNVYLSRFTGKLSGRLGTAHLNDLQQALEGAASVSYFGDASELVSFDMLARSAFVRFLLRHRKRFNEIVVLNWVSSAALGGQSLAATVGEPVLMLEDRHEFEHRLVSAAPRAAQLIRASGSHAIAAEVGGASNALRAKRG